MNSSPLRTLALVIVTLALSVPAQVNAQQTGSAPAAEGQAPSPGQTAQPPHHQMPMTPGMDMSAMSMTGPLNIGEPRDGSGTSWQPDVSPMYADHVQLGAWDLMVHGNGFLQYVREGSSRGDDQFGSVNWIMGMAGRHVAGGLFTARAMVSLEALTVGKCGYPDLLATGELCNGLAIHDRQHPHDLFMELAGRYQHAISKTVAVDLYGGPVGEPALGPTAFPHRLSAMPNPLAPISHHWLDATHISFGVITGGLYARRWKAEGSLFNGREPDDNRYDFDFGALDSYSGRFWFLPGERWAIQVSAGHLAQAELRQDGPPLNVNRVTASATYHRPLAGHGLWANTLAWGRNSESGAPSTNALLLETSATFAERHIVFGRAEFNQKTGDDLAIEPLADTVSFLTKVQGGYIFEFSRLGPVVPGIGGSAWVNIVPDRLTPYYGGTRSVGVAVFFSLHTPAMPMMTMSHAASGCAGL